MELKIDICPGTESNRRHVDFQSTALPTELPGLRLKVLYAIVVIESISIGYDQ